MGADIKREPSKPLQLRSAASDFFDKSWTCRYFFARNARFTINTKPYLWNYIEYNNKIMYSYSKPQKGNRGTISVTVCSVNESFQL